MSDPPVKLSKIAIGDGTLVDADVTEELPAVRTILAAARSK